jgi:hypothetical protein
MKNPPFLNLPFNTLLYDNCISDNHDKHDKRIGKIIMIIVVNYHDNRGKTL